jgi:hypothetical protein
MLQINFDALVSEHPELRHALRKLEQWMRTRGDVRSINPTALAREMRGVTPADLAATLMLLVQVGVLRIVYKVTTPSGVFADGEFDDPTQIPPKLPDRFERYFDTAESDVVPIFRMVA